MADDVKKRVVGVAGGGSLVRAGLSRRHRKDYLLRFFGLGSIILLLFFLGVLFASLISIGYGAFTRYVVTVPVYVDPSHVLVSSVEDGAYRVLFHSAVDRLAGEGGLSSGERRRFRRLFSRTGVRLLRDRVVGDVRLIGQEIALSVPLSDLGDLYFKGEILPDLPEDRRRLKDRDISDLESLNARGLISGYFNWGLFYNTDSRFPERAGLGGALRGSFYLFLVCALVSFPLGIGAAIYLEEFSKPSRLNYFIEVNINNLAAVPSVVFGLLGLAFFINFVGFPRSAPFVGGLTLALMTLPTIVIASRASLKAVSPSLRDAALGLGASRHQVVLHHVLPQAMPGILTGAIIGFARALGETAPLLLIGMNAFMSSLPESVFDPSTALPTQILIWSDSPERGFVALTSAAILILLGVLILMNALAVYMRYRFEKDRGL